MGFEFVFKEAKIGKGYALEYVNGVEPDGEYGVLEIPSSYRGKPVVAIGKIDPIFDPFPYTHGLRKRPHFKHLILPSTIGRLCGPRNGQIGRVDKLTMRGWSVSAYTDENGVYSESGFFSWGNIEVDTVVFEGEDIPPRLFYDSRSNAKINRVVAPNAKNIGEGAFCHTDVGEFELPYGLKAIGRGAFLQGNLWTPQASGKRLQNLKIPSTVIYIGPYAFMPQQVDRASLRGRNWEFMVPPKAYGGDGYTQRPMYRMCPDDIWKREEDSYIRYISRWLNAEKASSASGSLTPESEIFWEKFKKCAMVCGPEQKPRGMWFKR